MKIKRFLESEEVDISTERVGEIIEDLREFTSTIEDKNKMVESYINELNNYKNQSKKGNDQIDDSIAALQVVKKDLDDSLDKVTAWNCGTNFDVSTFELSPIFSVPSTARRASRPAF